MISHVVANPRLILALSVLSVVLSLPIPLASAAPPQPSPPSQAAQLAFFETKIRPLLVDRCYKCHQEKQKGGLRLDNRAALMAGGNSGPAVEAGNPDASLMIQAVRYSGDGVEKMPPDKKLPDQQVEDLIRWVKTGAPWTESLGPATPTAAHRQEFKVSEQDRNHWAFRPLLLPSLPKVRSTTWPRAAIDAFILAQLEAKKLQPAGPATRRDLLRRASFDLIGLPPTPEQLEAFERDPAPDAWARQIDRLLASPHYGERWARHWLDVVRYAQTNGYERDDEKPFAWRYRDYVIHSLNVDKSYDQFIREQLAGDHASPVTTDSLIATGFYRLGIWDDEPDDKRQAAFEEFDDIVATTSQAFLGLTIQCARCHDHKFDPIAQKDYYKLLAFFRNIKNYELPSYAFDSKTLAPLAPPEAVSHWRAQTEAKLSTLSAQLKATTDSKQRTSLESQIDRIQKTPPPFPPGLIISEHPGPAPKTQVLIRGNPGTPGEEVKPGIPTVLETSVSNGTPETKTSRRDLADWVSSPANPLTARVMVNRVWQHHFGRGLVATPNDFGKAGFSPTHPELLDWLAAEFIASGWSLKALHKRIMLSATYQMSSAADNPTALAVDEGNLLYWRQNLRRLEAESIRDTVLAVSGTLDRQMGGRGLFPRLSKEVLVGGSRPGRGWEISPRSPESRRGVYLFIKRTMLVPELETFDYTNTASPLGDRPVTTVAPQALLMLNSEFLRDQAAAFADTIERAVPSDVNRQARLAFSRALGREPSPSELAIALDYLGRRAAEIKAARPPLNFSLQVPAALYNGYLAQLKPEDILRGPARDWQFFPGRWGNGYEEIDCLDPLESPFALWSPRTFTNGTIETELRLDPASDSAALMIRATPAGAAFQGYDVTLDVKKALVTLRAHGSGKPRQIAEAPFDLAAAHWHKLKLEANGPHFRVWLDGADRPLIEVEDKTPITAPGYLGFRIWGSSIDVKNLSLTTAAARTRIDDPAPTTPEATAREALTSLCVIILNLNELMYVR